MTTMNVSGDYVVAAGQMLSFGDESPAITGGTSLTVLGTVTLNSSTAGIYVTGFSATGPLTIGAGGTVTVTGAGQWVTGYYDPSFVQNDGTFDVSNTGSGGSDGVAFGVNDDAYGRPWSFVNTADFAVSGVIAYGVDTYFLTSFDNSGDMVVSGTQQAEALSVSFPFEGEFHNSGAITVTAPAPYSFGVVLDSSYGADFDMTNTGVITAGTAIASFVVDSPASTRAIHLVNSGTINGDILLGVGPTTGFGDPIGAYAGSTILNTGAIHGAIHLNTNGYNLYDGRGGIETGGIYLGDAADVVYLGDDGETVYGGAGASTIKGGAGADTFVGGSGSELIDGGGGDDVLDGGGGVNTVSFASAGAGVTVSLAVQGQAQATGQGSKTLTNFQNVIGSAFADHLTGDAGDNVIDGGGGNDVLDGGGGANTMSFASAGAGVTVSLALQGQAQATGQGSKTLTNFQNLIGSAFADHLTGDAGDNVIDGGGGNDVLDGGGGVNTVSYASATSGVTVDLNVVGQAQNTGGGGTDTLSNFQNIIGSAYGDVLTAANGTSTLTGGLGADTFKIVSSADNATITDFTDYQGDRIVISNAPTLSSFADLQAHAQLVGSDTVISLGSGTLTLKNVSPGALNAYDFTFTYTSTQVSGHLTIAAGQTLTYTGANNGYGAYYLTGQGVLTVDGSLIVQDSGASDVLSGVNTGGSTGAPVFWIDPTGVVTVAASGSGASAAGFYAAQVAVGFENQGTFSVSSSTAPMGVDLNAGGIFVNTGTMTVTGQAGFATGLYAGGAVQVTNSGQVNVSSAGQVDAFHLVAGATMHNSGTITATSTGGVSCGVLAGATGGGVSTVYNTGTITAQYAVNGTVGPGNLILWNSGALNGAVVFGTAADNELHNSGSIAGTVSFDGTTGLQLYDGRGGSVTGHVMFASGSGAAGADYAYLGNDGETVQGGSAALFAYGGAGADHITAGAGAAFIDTGGGNDVLDGGSSGLSSVVFYSAPSGVTVSLALQGQAQNTGDGIDTLTHFGGLIGSKFDDHLTGDANNNVIDGGGGNDVLDGAGGFNSVSFVSAASGVSVSLALQGQAQNTGVGADVLANFQAVIGSAHNDTLEGGGPSFSYLSGGGGADTFVYRQGDGPVAVLDFSHAQGDQIDLVGFTGIHTLSDVLAHATQVGSDTLIDFVPNVGLRLVGVSIASLTPADFGLTGTTSPTVGPGVGGTPQTGNGTLNGGGGSDWLQGGAGSDTLHGGAGSDYLDGGAGLNTALYDGAYRQYAVGAGGATVSGGPEGGTDILANIERIQFVDGYMATSPTDTAGQVYRVYEATLGRAPDEEGLTNWVRGLNGGSSLQSVVDGFVNSTEFQQTYGSLDDAGFVTLLYHNVLHRDPDPGGLSNWVNLMNGGETRAQVVTGFSESQEDIAELSGPVQQGLWIGDAAAGQVARLYDAVLGRMPDGSGLASWTHALESGASLQGVADGFVASMEFQNTYGALNNSDYVTLLYHNVLHRPPDTAGLTNWVGMLNGGESRAQVAVGFSESGEHVANLAPYIDNGVWLAG